MPQNKTGKTALCGVFCGLAVVLLSLGGMIPVATFCAPALAGLCAVPVAVEYGNKSGVMVYLVTAVLSFFFCPDIEAVFMFVFLLGYYPLMKPKLDKIKHKVMRLIAKLGIFNFAILLCYGLLLFVFPLPALQQEMAEMGKIAVVGLIVLGNFTFLIYDAALVNIFHVYLQRFRPKIFSGKK